MRSDFSLLTANSKSFPKPQDLIIIHATFRAILHASSPRVAPHESRVFVLCFLFYSTRSRSQFSRRSSVGRRVSVTQCSSRKREGSGMKTRTLIVAVAMLGVCSRSTAFVGTTGGGAGRRMASYTYSRTAKHGELRQRDYRFCIS